MITSTRHYHPYSPLAAVVLIGTEVHHLPVTTVEVRVIDGEHCEHHPIVIAPDGQLLSVVAMAREKGVRYRIGLQADLANANRREQLEQKLRECQQ
jgi:hypothetical protein